MKLSTPIMLGGNFRSDSNLNFTLPMLDHILCCDAKKKKEKGKV